jgi:hypothetical protein
MISSFKKTALRTKKNYEYIILCTTFILLHIAATAPTIEIKSHVINHLIFIDVTQIMNSMDMTLDLKPVSQLEYTKYLIQKTVSDLPCGSRIGLGVFLNPISRYCLNQLKHVIISMCYLKLLRILIGEWPLAGIAIFDWVCNPWLI